MESESHTDKADKNIFISIIAFTAVILTLLLLLLGEDILIQLVDVYPDWGLPAFFIPWFLLIISSIQKLNKNPKKNKFALQVWILKPTIPLFVLTIPYFASKLATNNSILGFEPYCIFFAIVVLFILFLFPSKRLHNK